MELGEVMIDEVLLHLLDVREVSGRDLMLLEKKHLTLPYLWREMTAIKICKLAPTIFKIKLV